MKHGAWHKRQTYRDMTFRQVPNLTIEERQAELNKKLKPYSLDLSKHIPIEVAHGPGGGTPPSNYDPDAQAFFNAVQGGGDTLTTTEKDATNQLVLDLKDNSLWSVFDGFYPFVGGTASSHKWNLLDPQDTNAAHRIIWLGGMSHSSTGILGNAVNSGGNTYWNYVSESATEMSVGLYVNDGLTATPYGAYDYGSFLETPTRQDNMISIGFSNKTTKYVNFNKTQYKSTTAGSYTKGLFLGQSNGADTSQLYQNDTQIFSTAQTIYPTDFYWGIACSLRLDAFNTIYAGGSPERGYGTAFIGKTYLNQTQITALNTSLVDFNTTLSRN